MSDVLERLRTATARMHPQTEIASVMAEAAAEIANLRACNEQLQSLDGLQQREIERLRAEADDLRTRFRDEYNASMNLRLEVEWLTQHDNEIMRNADYELLNGRDGEQADARAEVERLRAALEFYADADNYRSTRSSPIVSTGVHRASPVEQDFGRKAFHALGASEQRTAPDMMVSDECRQEIADIERNIRR